MTLRPAIQLIWRFELVSKKHHVINDLGTLVDLTFFLKKNFSVYTCLHNTLCVYESEWVSVWSIVFL